jgi:hypothetical protein
VCAQPDILGGCGETTGAILGAAPFRSAFLFSLGQSTPHTLGVEVLGIDWCAGLLPPGLLQPSGIDAVEAQFIDELQDNSLGCLVVARNRQGDATDLRSWSALPKSSASASLLFTSSTMEHRWAFDLCLGKRF